MDAWNVMLKDKKILLVGAVQSLFEGAMYIFVLQWPPSMIAVIAKRHFYSMCCLFFFWVLQEHRHFYSVYFLLLFPASFYKSIAIFFFGAQGQCPLGRSSAAFWRV